MRNVQTKFNNKIFKLVWTFKFKKVVQYYNPHYYTWEAQKCGFPMNNIRYIE